MNGIWVTREGKQIPIETLDDGHLLNIVAMLIRTSFAREFLLFRKTFCGAIQPSGDGACMAFDREVNAFIDRSFPEFLESSTPPWLSLVRELVKRRLLGRVRVPQSMRGEFETYASRVAAQ